MAIISTDVFLWLLEMSHESPKYTFVYKDILVS